jgi:hypothetical protein
VTLRYWAARLPGAPAAQLMTRTPSPPRPTKPAPVLSWKSSFGGSLDAEVEVEVEVSGLVPVVDGAEVVPVVVTEVDGVVVSVVVGAVVVVVSEVDVDVVVSVGEVLVSSSARAAGVAAKVASAAAETTPATRFSVLPTMTPNGG